MKKDIRILLLEDEIADAELVKYALGQSGLTFSFGRVETRDEFVQHLADSPPSLILSDYQLPGFDGLAALEVAREKLPDVPFIFVTGTLGEERAIETLRRGATDYVLKTRLHALAPAVHRALREADERAERRRAEERLRESSEQLRALSVYLQYVREEERTRIAREVHDELGQSLSSLKLDLAWFSSRLPKGTKELTGKINEMSRRIDTTIHTVRRIATELRPGILDDLGLVAALEWQGKDFQNRTGIFCEVVAAIRDHGLDADLNTAFFRIFQETLTNIMRHANATRVDVRLTDEHDRLVLTVQDNGRGITAAEIRDTKSIGLLGMCERAALLGGEVSFHGEPGRGTLVTVSIPLPRARGPRGGLLP
ncbi:MAG: response regulator [Verrucomicrobia bacterium]|nr:response regulator [Verrucomicrobiota bacterium]